MKYFPELGDILTACTERPAPARTWQTHPLTGEHFKDTILAAAFAYRASLCVSQSSLPPTTTPTLTHAWPQAHGLRPPSTPPAPLSTSQCPLHTRGTGSKWMIADLTCESATRLTSQMVGVGVGLLLVGSSHFPKYVQRNGFQSS